MYKNKSPLEQIAQETNLTTRSVSRIISNPKRYPPSVGTTPLTPRRKKRINIAEIKKQVIAMYNAGTSVSTIISKLGIRKIIMDMHNTGTPISTISYELGIGKQTIYNIINAASDE